MGLMKYATLSGLVQFVGLHFHRALPCAKILFPCWGIGMNHICYMLISSSTSMACSLVDIIFVKINLLFMHIKE